MRRKREIHQLSLFDESSLKEALYPVCGTSLNDIVSRLLNLSFWFEKRKLEQSFATLEISKEGNIVDILNQNYIKEFIQCNRVSQKFSKSVLNILKIKDFRFLTCYVVEAVDSNNMETTKLLIALEDGYKIETMILRHKKRTTICVSSQAGCKMGCTFCATGSLGYEANLASGEIIQQLILAQRYLDLNREDRNITNVVFMGMGEPMNNYDSVSSSLRSLLDTKRLALSADKVTVSTVGVISNFKRLAYEFPGLKLALSLHASDQKLREVLIPTATAYKLDSLMDCLLEIIEFKKKMFPNKKKRQKVMIEFILIRDVNDTTAEAHRLSRLLLHLKDYVLVNLIPYNPIYNPIGFAKEYKAPKSSNVANFQDVLLKSGYFCTTRTEMGQDVNGACGQLALVKKHQESKLKDLEDLVPLRKAHIPSRRKVKRLLPVKKQITNTSLGYISFARHEFNICVAILGVIIALMATWT